ncbi:MAG TPA: AAA family ATPase [Phototrophicaceae bacterium]|jgi:protein phosphatase|nr:AAA family ATPase [Phototrophicaceae bacterium]
MLHNITIPDFALVVLIGASGSGKSTFARTHFLPTEIISSDFCRELVSDDENDQTVSKEAFEVLHFIAAKRLELMKLTVIDATSVQFDSRKPLIKLARDYHALPVAIVLDVPDRVSIERNQQRPDRTFGPHVIARQRQDLKRSLRGLESERFRRVIVLKSETDVAEVTVTREPLWNNRKTEHGPFDIIGDVHGCYDELMTLLEQLGYQVDTENMRAIPPEGRKAIFLGNLVDRGPKIPQVLKLVMSMVEAETALCIPGNHDIKLMRKLRGKNVQITHGLADSLAQLEAEPPEFHRQAADFIDSLTSHYILDDGKLVVAHAGMKESMAGRASGTVREFALYGETTGETDEFGLPVRYNWAAEYRGDAMVVYGHTPVPEPEWLNRTINIDTGCVFGGALTALRYPEQELVAVPALYTYAEPARPFLEVDQQAPGLTNFSAAARRLAGYYRCSGAGCQYRETVYQHPFAKEYPDPRRECRRSAGSHESLCRQSKMAGLFTPDYVTSRNQQIAQFTGTSRRSLYLLSQQRHPAGNLRRKAHGFTRCRRHLQR